MRVPQLFWSDWQDELQHQHHTLNPVQRGRRTPAVHTRVPRLFWSDGQDVAQLPQ